MGLQLMFGYLVGNLRLENRFTQGWKIGLQTSYMPKKYGSFRESLVYIIRIIGNKGTEGRRGERLRKITGFLHCSLIGALR